MHFQPYRTCTHRAEQRHQHSLRVLSKEPWDTPSAASPGNLEMVPLEHNQVLKTITEAIRAGLMWVKQFQPYKKIIAFVKLGRRKTLQEEHLTTWKKPSRDNSSSMQDWSVTVSRMVGV